MLLAAALLAGLRRRRHTQARARRPGRALPDTPVGLAPVAKTLIAAGEPALPTLTHLDQTLRRLASGHAARHQPMPALTAVSLDPAGLSLHLATPASLNPPWQPLGDDQRGWRLAGDADLDQVGPAVADQPAPYPLLVTVGAAADGAIWLANLEHAGDVALVGDPERRTDLARFIAAELACNPWSTSVDVTLAGVAPEAAALNPDRVTTHPAPTAALIEQLRRRAAANARRATAAGQDQPELPGRPTRPRNVDRPRPHRHHHTTTGTTATDTAAAVATALAGLRREIADHPGRTGTALITVADHADGAAVTWTVDADGRLRIPDLAVEVAAVGLTADEAAGCAALLAAGDELDDVPMPDIPPPADGWRRHANQAGALRADHTTPRRPPPDQSTTGEQAQPDGGGSAELGRTLLPRPDSDYVDAAATTADDLARLAPQVPVRHHTTVAAADPSLDEDVAAWHAQPGHRPRLRLLGPVHLDAYGTPLTKRKPYYTELVAYLALRPHGATPDQVGDAFGLTPARVRNDLKIVRDWLGDNPATGRRHLPDARDSHAAHARGVAVYQIDGLLVDLDLFRRLRVRGDTQGADGITDYTQALQLVTGVPFDHLRPGGWTWLFDGDRVDQHLTCGIVDVAHLLCTHHLAAHNLPAARAAAETATAAAPYEDTPRLDLAAVLHAEGHTDQAAELVADQICDRSDDHTAPDDLPDRTTRVIGRRGWDKQMRPAS